MIILIGGTKGGTGKSTLAANISAQLAIRHREALLVDSDRQESSMHFAALRQKFGVSPKITPMAVYGDQVASTLRDMAPKFEHIIVDAGGFDSVELRSAMLAADKMIVPTRPGLFDYLALCRLDSLVADAKAFNEKLHVSLLLNCMPSNPNCSDEDVMRESVSQLKHIHAMNRVMRQRKAFGDSVALGRSVTEVDKPNEKAVFELLSVYEEIFNGNAIPVA